MIYVNSQNVYQNTSTNDLRLWGGGGVTNLLFIYSFTTEARQQFET